MVLEANAAGDGLCSSYMTGIVILHAIISVGHLPKGERIILEHLERLTCQHLLGY